MTRHTQIILNNPKTQTLIVMKRILYYFICVTIAIAAMTACNNECPEPEECEVCKNHKCPEPEECEICKNHKCPEPFDYLVQLNFAFVSGDYYGDDNDDGMAKYAMVMSVDYDGKEITRAPELGKANDVFYLTLFSDIAYDTYNALPEAGRYNVAPEKGAYTLMAGKSKTEDNEYEGSYIVSTVDGVAQESKITGGYIQISYVDNKSVVEFELEDEAGILNRYADIELKYTGNGKESYVDHTGIEYYVFERQRSYYWGPADGARASDSGEELGDYLYELSDRTFEHTYVSFYILEEYEFYGLDAAIKPGIYRVNQEVERGGVKGTIYKHHDLSDPMVWRYGTASVTLIDGWDEVDYYAIDGWMAALTDESGAVNRLIVKFYLDNGEIFYGRYDVGGSNKLHIGDEWTVSNFREDVYEDSLPGAYMRIKDPDFWYGEAGTNQWQMFLMGNGVSVSVDEWGYMTIHGPGDCFRLEFSVDSNAATDGLPAGTYEIKDSYEAGVAQYGDKSIGYIGIYSGAWFHRIPGNGEDQMHGMGMSGEVKVSKNGTEYTIETTFYDDAKNTFYGKYVGVPTIEDHRTSTGSAPYQFKGYDMNDATGNSTAYSKAREERMENARIRLK